MDAWQVLKQVKYLLQVATWGDSPSDRVFGPSGADSVRITPGVDYHLLEELRFPQAFVMYRGGDGDAEEDLIRTSRIQVSIMALNFNDRFGEAAILGANRLTSDGSGDDRGILEVLERTMNALDDLGQDSGVTILGHLAGDAEPIQVRGLQHVLELPVTLEVEHEAVRSYPPVERLAGSEAGGTVTLTWTDPATRFDSSAIYLERKSGSSSYARGAGTALTGVALGVGTTTNAPGSGTWTYGVWASYDEDGDGTVERYSAHGSDDAGEFVTVVVP